MYDSLYRDRDVRYGSLYGEVRYSILLIIGRERSTFRYSEVRQNSQHKEVRYGSQSREMMYDC